MAVARAALIEEGGAAAVGEHVSVISHGDGVAEHRFAATVPGYCGWEWCVILACVPGSNRITVNEVALLPGAQALQAPAWVPWADRLQASERDNNGAEEAGASAEDQQDAEDAEEV